MRTDRTRFHGAGLALAALVALACSGHPSAPKVASGAQAEAASSDADAAEAEQPAVTGAGGESSSSEDDMGHGEGLDDSGEADEAEPMPVAAEKLSERPHPLDGWSDARIAAAVKQDPKSLGSMSVGSPNGGALINGIQASGNDFYKPVSPSGAWGTDETLKGLERALIKVHEQFPGTPPLALGDISGQHGGASPPHVSHQSGRDVDIAYFYNDGAGWYARGTAKNLDLPRTWAFVRALITETDIDLILIDHSIQVLLEDYARSHGDDPAWLSSVFRGVPGKLRPLIRHAPGHATHIHIRFFNPIAQETARRCYPYLLAARLTSAPQTYVTHKVKKNETLGMIARKYGLSIPALRSANGLKSSLIREKSVLRVPTKAKGPAGPGPRLRLPERRIAPSNPSGPPSSAADIAEPAPQPPPTR